MGGLSQAVKRAKADFEIKLLRLEFFSFSIRHALIAQQPNLKSIYETWCNKYHKTFSKYELVLREYSG